MTISIWKKLKVEKNKVLEEGIGRTSFQLYIIPPRGDGYAGGVEKKMKALLLFS
jgi:hypothetical protein